MAARSKIVEIGRSSAADIEPDTVIEAEAVPAESMAPAEPEWPANEEADYGDWSDDEDVQSRNWKSTAAISFAILIVIGWSGVFGWAFAPEILSVPTLARSVELVSIWAVPVALIALIWLLVQRNSHAEARRFGDVSQRLRSDSDALNARMQLVNGEIALARSFLAENAREIDSVGRQSADRLNEAARTLNSALADADEKARLLAQVSEAAIANLEQLRNHLPVVTSAAKDATNHIAIAGNTAQSQIQAMTSSLEGMQEASTKAATLCEEMKSGGLSVVETIDASIAKAEAGFVALFSKLLSDTTEIFGDAHQRAQALQTSISESGAALDSQIEGSEARLAARLADLRTTLDRIAGTTDSSDEKLNAMVSQLNASLDECETRLAGVNDRATDRVAKLAFAVSSLSQSSADLQERLSENRSSVETIVAKAEQLMLGLDNASREIDESLPSAFVRMRGEFESCIDALQKVQTQTGEVEAQSTKLLGQIESVDRLIDGQSTALQTLLAESDSHFASRHDQADALAASLQQTHALIEDMAGTANEQLVASLLRVRETTRQAAESSKQILDEELTGVAEKLSEQNRALLSQAVETQLGEIDGVMREAVSRNINLASDATEQMRAQLAAIDDMTANLERRITQARGQFDGLDDESFTRRMALLTESLNSSAIDVAKILSNEVTDTAWASYLKGDRGVFTRRAVKLLDAGEAKIIAAHYDNDSEFREHVNRYIHDFEAMMRVLLSTRDGNAIGVTLLSSDVGKLYVALAQAIERLRN